MISSLIYQFSTKILNQSKSPLLKFGGKEVWRIYVDAMLVLEKFGLLTKQICIGWKHLMDFSLVKFCIAAHSPNSPYFPTIW